MLVAWSRGTGGNLFPLCRSTAFELTFQDCGLYWCPRASTPQQTSLQNIRFS